MNPQELNPSFLQGVGHDAGPVRAPLTDFLPNEVEPLGTLIKKLGAQ